MDNFLAFQVCYAFRGEIDTVTLRIYVKYTDKSGQQTHINLYHESACSRNWQYECINLNDMATNNADLWNNKQTGSIMYVKDIYISPEAMVDDVWIGTTLVSGICPCCFQLIQYHCTTEPPPHSPPLHSLAIVPLKTTRCLNSFSVLNRNVAGHPNGHWIKEFETEKLSETSFRLKMTPAYCGDGIPLISIAGVPRTDDDQQSSFNFSDIGATVTVERTKAAIRPLTGTFDITFENTTITGILLWQVKCVNVQSK